MPKLQNGDSNPGSLWHLQVLSGILPLSYHGTEHESKHVPYLNEGSHVGEVLVHGAPVWEVGRHSLHELAETAVGHRLCHTNT